jgi:hypothetical protein
MSKRTEVLAVRLEEGARALVALVRTLTDAEWQTPTKDGRKIGVVVHHVGNMYPLEIQLALTLGKGEAIAGVTWDDVHAVNARHAKDFAKVTKESAVHFVEIQSTAAAEAIRQLTTTSWTRRRRCRSTPMPLTTVHPGGSRGAAQLSSPGEDPRGPQGGGCRRRR